MASGPGRVVVELYGVARLRAGVGAVQVEASSIGVALRQVAAAAPALVDSVLVGESVRPSFLLNLNGDRFVTDPGTPLSDGDRLILLSADAGG